MSVRESYNAWAEIYDSNDNKTRDLEARAVRHFLAGLKFEHGLEVACGTGKNTGFLLECCKELTAIDLSEKMLERAKQKIGDQRVTFLQADITQPWHFTKKTFDLLTFSLVLEHIADLEPIFKELDAKTSAGAHLYIGELHPFKQYSGSKARFETEQGVHVVSCHTHHVADFLQTAKRWNFDFLQLEEFFDDDDKSTLPRILALLFRKR